MLIRYQGDILNDSVFVIMKALLLGTPYNIALLKYTFYGWVIHLYCFDSWDRLMFTIQCRPAVLLPLG